MITSTGNAQVKEIIALRKKAKVRKEKQVFLVEGIKMFLETPKQCLVKTFVSESFLKEKENKLLLQGISYEMVSDTVFSYMADTQTPQGILAVVRQMQWTLEKILGQGQSSKDSFGRENFNRGSFNRGSLDKASFGKESLDKDRAQIKTVPRLLLLETIQDPGNLGTILRTAEGAGITGIIMNEETVDIYSPKVIRSTMGAIYRVPFVYVKDWKQALQTVKKQNVKLYAAHLSAEHSYEEEDYTKQGFGFLIGNEGNGLTDETAGMADTFIKIPMEGQVESLNAAIATSILIFEAARQRRRGFVR